MTYLSEIEIGETVSQLMMKSSPQAILLSHYFPPSYNNEQFASEHKHHLIINDVAKDDSLVAL